MKSLLITDLDETLLHDNGEKNGYLPSGELDLDYFRTDRELPTLKEAIPNIIGLNVLKYFSGNNVEISFCTARGNTYGVFDALRTFLSKHYKYKSLKNKINYSHSLGISDLAKNDLDSDTAGEKTSWIQSRYDEYDQIFFMDDRKQTIDYIRENFPEITTIWIKTETFDKIIQSAKATAFDAGQKMANEYPGEARNSEFIHRLVKQNNEYIHQTVLKDIFDYSDFIDCSDKSLGRDLCSYFKQNKIFQASIFRTFCGGIVNNFKILKESLITESKKKLVLMEGSISNPQNREEVNQFSDGFNFYSYNVGTGEIKKTNDKSNRLYTNHIDSTCPGYRGAALRVWECNWNTQLTKVSIKEPTGEKYEIDYRKKTVYHDDIFLDFKDVEEQSGFDNWLYYLVNHEDDLALIEFSQNKTY